MDVVGQVLDKPSMNQTVPRREDDDADADADADDSRDGQIMKDNFPYKQLNAANIVFGRTELIILPFQSHLYEERDMSHFLIHT